MHARALNGAHFSRTRSARRKRDHAGVVHKQQRHTRIIFGLFRPRNKGVAAVMSKGRPLPAYVVDLRSADTFS
jgi:hypothetical protein